MNKNNIFNKYTDAGVNIPNATVFTNYIKKLTSQGANKGLLSGIGGFNAMMKIPSHFHEPVLVSCTDGVGTKVKLAADYKMNNNIGEDLVAMCVNDLLVSGAEPLFFLDYMACSKLNLPQAKDIVNGIVSGCQKASCSLVGGETAEMPGIYSNNDYDIAGFCVGVVEQSKIIDPTIRIKQGDLIIGLNSSGFHANGYSLLRKILENNSLDPTKEKMNGKSLISLLLKPTIIYNEVIQNLIKNYPIHGIAHITGGGFIENIPRIIPDGFQAVIDASKWDIPDFMQWMYHKGNISIEESFGIFNNGIGMIIVISKQYESEILDTIQQQKLQAYNIGYIDQAKNINDKISIHIE